MTREPDLEQTREGLRAASPRLSRDVFQHDLELAREVQQALYPTQLPELRGAPSPPPISRHGS